MDSVQVLLKMRIDGTDVVTWHRVQAALLVGRPGIACLCRSQPAAWQYCQSGTHTRPSAPSSDLAASLVAVVAATVVPALSRSDDGSRTLMIIDSTQHAAWLVAQS